MRIVRVSKAQPHMPTDYVDPIRISVSDEMPEYQSQDYRQRYEEFYELQASAVEEALFASLPGGTYDALLRAFLKRKASLLRVKMMP